MYDCDYDEYDYQDALGDIDVIDDAVSSAVETLKAKLANIPLNISLANMDKLIDTAKETLLEHFHEPLYDAHCVVSAYEEYQQRIADEDLRRDFIYSR